MLAPVNRNQLGSLLSTFGQPRIGRSDFGVRVSPVQQGAAVALRFGVIVTDIPIPGGCSMRTPELVSIAARADSRGSARFDLPLPNDRSLRGASLYGQAVFLEPGGPLFGSLGLSAGLRMVIGE